MFMRKIVNHRLGMTLMELLCSLLIISLLAAMYLGAIGKAYVWIKRVLGQ